MIRAIKSGAVIVTEDNSQVLAVGYNGNYSGGPNEVESDTTWPIGHATCRNKCFIKNGL